MHNSFQGFNLLAIDWDGPITTEANESVDIPLTERPISAEDFHDLTQLINPMTYSTEHGIDVYLQCVDFVCTRMNVN